MTGLENVIYVRLYGLPDMHTCACICVHVHTHTHTMYAKRECNSQDNIPAVKFLNWEHFSVYKVIQPYTQTTDGK